MIFRGTDSNGDWLFGKGKSDYLTKLDALKMNVKTRLLSWKNDCFFAPDDGVDYDNYLDIGTKSLLDLDIKRVILQSEGVLKITEFESELDHEERLISISATIETIFGVTEVDTLV